MSKFVHPLQLDQFFVGQPHLSIQISNPVGQIGFEKKKHAWRQVYPTWFQHIPPWKRTIIFKRDLGWEIF